MATQLYLGSPNAVVLCINEFITDEGQSHIRGVMYHSYQEEGTPFENLDEMTMHMEELYDRLGFPHPTTNSRSFVDVKPNYVHVREEKIMSDDQVLSKHGEIGTFIVRVQHRQNSSWQGRLTWVDKDQTVNFRSIWEMIKLIESAVDTVSDPEEEEEPEQRWDL